MMRNAIGPSGSYSPMAANLRFWSKTIARSPGAPRWLSDVIEASYTQG